MKNSAAILPPLDRNAVENADGETKRRIRYLRKALAEGGLSDSRRRLLDAELRALQHRDGEPPA